MTEDDSEALEASEVKPPASDADGLRYHRDPVQHTAREHAWMLVRERFLSIVALIGLGLIGAFLAGWGLPSGVPRWVRLGGIVAVAIAIPAWVWAGKVADFMDDPVMDVLVDVDARTDHVGVWLMPPAAIGELDVEGELDTYRGQLPVHFCRDFDAEELTATGTWLGELSEYELMQEREKLDESRTWMKEQADAGLAIEMRQGSITYETVYQILAEEFDALNSEAMPKGELVREAIEMVAGDSDRLLDAEDGDGPESTSTPSIRDWSEMSVAEQREDVAPDGGTDG